MQTGDETGTNPANHPTCGLVHTEIYMSERNGDLACCISFASCLMYNPAAISFERDLAL